MTTNLKSAIVYGALGIAASVLPVWSTSAQISQYPGSVTSAQLALIEGHQHATCEADQAYYSSALFPFAQNIDNITSNYYSMREPILLRRLVQFIDGRDEVRLASADKLLQSSCTSEAGSVYREVIRSSKDVPNQNRAMLGLRDAQDQQHAEASKNPSR